MNLKKLNMDNLKEISPPLYFITDSTDVILIDSSDMLWVLIMKELNNSLANKLMNIENFITIYKLLDENKQKTFFKYLTKENKLRIELS